MIQITRLSIPKSTANKYRPKEIETMITTTVVAYTSFCDGHVTRFSSFRTSLKNRRARSKRPPAASFIVSSVVGDEFTAINTPKDWQARRESNPQPPVLETGALPIELLAFTIANC